MDIQNKIDMETYKDVNLNKDVKAGEKSRIEEEKLDAEKILTTIENRSLDNYFNSGSGLKDAQKVFGQTEEEIEKEFKNYKARKMFGRMDYLLINNTLSTEEIKKECEIAVHYGFKSVTVLPSMLKFAKNAVSGSNITVRALISYPFGEDVFEIKRKACKIAVKNGADAIAVTLSTSAIKNGEVKNLAKEVLKISKMARKKKVTVIIDTSKLNPIELKNTAIAIADECKVYSILPSSLFIPEKPQISTIKEVIKAVDGKCFIESGGNLATAEETVSILSLGASTVTSQKCPLIAKDALKKLNA